MREARRNPELALVVLGELLAHPPAEGGRAPADIDGHVPDAAAHHAHELALGMRRQLVVQAAQHTPGGAAVVVLHEVDIRAGGGMEGLLVETFVEKAARVAEDLGLDQENVRDGGGGGVHVGMRGIRG